MNASAKYGIIILAAGPSSRMGQPKQLLSYRNKSLLNHTIHEAKKVEDGIVVVILGGNYPLIAAHLKDDGVKPDDIRIKIVHNPDWEEGMSSSIRMGLLELMQEYYELEGVILTVCDQPFLSAEVLNTLITKAKTTGKSIVASSYQGTSGTPVLFLRNYFDDLIVLKGKEGAKMLLKQYSSEVSTVPFDKGEIDIDTPKDYNRLINKHNDKGFFQPDT